MSRTARVFYATDFSPASAPAFTQALASARAEKSELAIVHVLGPVVAMMGDGYLPPSTYEQIERSQRADAVRRLAKLAARARKHGVRTRTLLLEGTPWQAITRAAKAGRARVIVLGTHGRSGLAKLFLGSVAERVVATAPCPVLTVRGRSRR
jgi:universal stress protein A